MPARKYLKKYVQLKYVIEALITPHLGNNGPKLEVMQEEYLYNFSSHLAMASLDQLLRHVFGEVKDGKT